jgi:hypothetical protein
MKSEGEYGTVGNNGTDGTGEMAAIPFVPLFPTVPYSLLVSDLWFRTAGSTVDFKSRERDRALEFDSQNGAGLESDVVAFGHQHAAKDAGSNAAR